MFSGGVERDHCHEMGYVGSFFWHLKRFCGAILDFSPCWGYSLTYSILITFFSMFNAKVTGSLIMRLGP